MARVDEVKYEFVDSAPQQLEPGTLYISIKYRAIVHLCLCGCGEKVFLKLDPEQWSFTFDGRSVSIHDSVGNIGIPCRSHYIVRNNRAHWLRPLHGVNPEATLLDTHRHELPAEQPSLSRSWFARLRDRLH